MINKICNRFLKLEELRLNFGIAVTDDCFDEKKDEYKKKLIRQTLDVKKFSKLKNLKVLVLNGNMLDGKLPESIYNLTKLEQLMLTSNNLSGSISNDVSKLENLEVLNLFDNNLNGNLPLAVLKLENLKELKIEKAF